MKLFLLSEVTVFLLHWIGLSFLRLFKKHLGDPFSISFPSSGFMAWFSSVLRKILKVHKQVYIEAYWLLDSDKLPGIS